MDSPIRYSYSAHDIGKRQSEYWDNRVRLSRRRRQHISGNTCPIFTKVLCMLSMTVALRYVMYFRFVDDLIFAHNGPYGAYRAIRLHRMTTCDVIASCCAGYSAMCHIDYEGRYPARSAERLGRSLQCTIAMFLLLFVFALGTTVPLALMVYKAL